MTSSSDEETRKHDASNYLLACSAEAYADSMGRALSTFKIRSVDAHNQEVKEGEEKISEIEEMIEECKSQLAEKAKEAGAEVVTDIKHSTSGGYRGRSENRNNAIYREVYMTGTALISK